MSKLPPFLRRIHNSGERLIPGVTHDFMESVRHRNSYLFFRRVIEHDLAMRENLESVRIIDLGCGVGHGCKILAGLPNVQVVGVDFSLESIEYARAYYDGDNITYEVADLLEYVPEMPEFDYVVSRNVFEHLPEGLWVALSTKWRNRLLFDVPYDEPEGRNAHHALSHIREEDFAMFPEAELFFQDMQGLIYNGRRKLRQPNVIICVASRPGISRASHCVEAFPLSFPTQGAQSELPLVSVITPAYNRETLLDQVIRSVQRQDYPNVEHIVLDDGSTDGTPEILKSYDGKIRWDSHENMGEARTVNKGFSIARGEIIGVVNSDDPLLPGAISTMVTYLLAHPDVLVAYPDWTVIDEGGETIRDIKTYEYDYVDMVRRHHCMPGPGVFFRRSLVDRIGGRDPGFRFVGDFDFWMRAGLAGPFARVPATLATFRYHAESYSTNQLGRAMADEHIRLTDKVFANPNLPQEVQKVKWEAYSSAYYIAGTQCGENAPPAVSRRYFLRALLHAPHKYLTEYRGRWRKMLPVLLGRGYEPLRRAARPIHRGLRAITKRLGAGRV